MGGYKRGSAALARPAGRGWRCKGPGGRKSGAPTPAAPRRGAGSSAGGARACSLWPDAPAPGTGRGGGRTHRGFADAAGAEAGRGRRVRGPARDDDRLRPGPRRALGGESAPGSRIPEPATPPSPAPPAPEEPSRWVLGARGRRPRGAGVGSGRPGRELPCTKQGSRAGIAGAEERPGGPVRGVPRPGGAGAAWWRLNIYLRGAGGGEERPGLQDPGPCAPFGPRPQPCSASGFRRSRLNPPLPVLRPWGPARPEGDGRGAPGWPENEDGHAALSPHAPASRAHAWL